MLTQISSYTFCFLLHFFVLSRAVLWNTIHSHRCTRILENLLFWNECGKKRFTHCVCWICVGIWFLVLHPRHAAVQVVSCHQSTALRYPWHGCLFCSCFLFHRFTELVFGCMLRYGERWWSGRKRKTSTTGTQYVNIDGCFVWSDLWNA